MPLSKFFPAILLCSLFAFSACGPMNTEKKTDSNVENSGKTLKGIASSQNNTFYLHAALQGVATPEVGDNIYSIRAVHAGDLSSLSNQAKVSASYWMPDMPAMGKSDAVAAREADGSFAITLFYSMAGRWEVTVTVQDGDKQDNYVFETTL